MTITRVLSASLIMLVAAPALATVSAQQSHSIAVDSVNQRLRVQPKRAKAAPATSNGTALVKATRGAPAQLPLQPVSGRAGTAGVVVPLDSAPALAPPVRRTSKGGKVKPA